MPILEVIEDDSSPFLINTPKPDFEKLTKEEQTALLDHISSQVANDPETFERIASNFLQQATQQDFNTVNVQPQPGFVCKTHVVSSQSPQYKVGTVVYINICHAAAIPAPSIASEQEIQKALNAEPDSTYKVPLSMGQPRKGDRDALIMDACIHTQPYLRSEKDLDFRLYLLELSMEYVEDIVSVSLSREFTMPTAKSIGVIPTRVLRLPKPSLITAIRTELKDVWTLQPTFTVNQNQLVVIIPMPDKNVNSWSVDITSKNFIELTIGKQMHRIPLKAYEIADIQDTANKVDFYTKSQELVVELTLINRSQYL